MTDDLKRKAEKEELLKQLYALEHLTYDRVADKIIAWFQAERDLWQKEKEELELLRRERVTIEKMDEDIKSTVHDLEATVNDLNSELDTYSENIGELKDILGDSWEMGTHWVEGVKTTISKLEAEVERSKKIIQAFEYHHQDCGVDQSLFQKEKGQ